MRSTLKLAAFVLLLVALTSFSVAQEITASIVGTVADSTGAAVPDATVTITNIDTRVVVRTIKTDASGAYSAPLLPIGRYSVTAEAAGFKKVTVANIELNVNDRKAINPVLQVGSTGEVVTVEANALQVETQTAENSTLISGTEIRELSLNSRNYEQLVTLMPGVSYGGASDQLYVGTTNPLGGANTVQFSINGQRSSQNNWTVDGTDNVDRGSNLTVQQYPSVDAIAEFKVQRGLYSAESGRAGGGQINVVTRSGTDQFHGGAYEFWRNDKLAANTYINKNRAVPFVRPPLRYHNFGYTIGGPIRRGSTFFFFSHEFRRVINYVNTTAFVPTAAMKAGNFPVPVCRTFNATRTACAAGGTSTTIPISPIAQAYITDIWSKIPEGNNPASLSAPFTLDVQLRNKFNHRQEIAKIDHIFSDKLRGFFRFLNDTIPTEEPTALFSSGTPLPGVSNTKTDSPGRSYTGRLTWNLTPKWIIEGGYSYSSGGILSEVTGLVNPANSPNVAAATAAVMPFQSQLRRIPTLTFSTISSITSFGHYDNTSHNHNTFANVTKLWGSHSIKFGGSFHRYNKLENSIAGLNTGRWTFATTGSPGAAGGYSATSVGAMQSFANFLQGISSGFTQVSTDPFANIFANQFETYFQDDWRISRNLTLNLGVRYSIFGQPVDANGRLTNFDPTAFNPAQALAVIGGTGATSGQLNPVQPAGANPLNGLVINGVNSPWGDRVGETPKNNFAPRLGVAWAPWGDDTVFRAGWGMFFDPYLFGVFQQNVGTNPPYVDTLSFSNVTFAAPTGGAGSTPLPRPLRATPLKGDQPYVQHFSLDVQHAFTKNMLFTIGYVGSKGTHLIGAIDINQPVPGQWVTAGLGSAPIGGVVPFLNSTNIQRINSIRPYPGWGAINAILPIFGSNYHSLQSTWSMKFGGGGLIKANYTWQKGMTDNQTDRSTAPQNSYNIRGEYGPTQFDRPHIASVHWNYELPWHRNQKGVIGHILGGWQLSGIAAFNAGLPLTVTSSTSMCVLYPTQTTPVCDAYDPAGLGNRDPNSLSAVRPRIIGDPNAGGQRTFLNWFNTGAYDENLAGQYVPGTARRGEIRGPGFQRWDISVFKNVKITERWKLQLRTEMFNAFNHTNFQGVQTQFGNVQFGQVTSVRDNRVIQLGAKLNF